MLNTRTVGGHRPRSNAPTPVISVGGTEGRQPGSLFSVQLISRGGTQSSNPSPSSRESANFRSLSGGHAGDALHPRGGGRIAGCDPIIAVDRLPSRLALVRELSATHTLESRGAAGLIVLWVEYSIHV